MKATSISLWIILSVLVLAFQLSQLRSFVRFSLPATDHVTTSSSPSAKVHQGFHLPVMVTQTKQRSQPAKGVFEPCKRVQSNNTPTDLLMNTELGWDTPQGPAQWVRDLCPQVVEHLNQFPYFQRFPVKNGTSLPVATTEYTSRMLCTLSLIQNITNRLNITVHLDAGSHLGAARHGQPVPWDDDVDVAIPFRHVKTFLRACQEGSRVHPTAQLKCAMGYKCLKVYVEYEGMEKQEGVDLPKAFMLPRGHYKWKSPFVDVFVYKIWNDRVVLVKPDKPTARPIQRHPGYAVRDYFPLQFYYFGGLSILAPPAQWAEKRYSFTECYLAKYHHRYETQFGWKEQGLFDTLEVDCCRLATRFPFVYRNGTMSNGQSGVSIQIPTNAQRFINATAIA